jgi:hypothetical protein
MLTAVRVARLPQWFEEFGPRLAERLGTRLAGRLRMHARHRPLHASSASALARPAPALRVLRVLEPHQPRAAAGRMVISGRMADVCAELDRLAAAESAPAPH